MWHRRSRALASFSKRIIIYDSRAIALLKGRHVEWFVKASPGGHASQTTSIDVFDVDEHAYSSRPHHHIFGMTQPIASRYASEPNIVKRKRSRPRIVYNTRSDSDDRVNVVPSIV